MKRLNTPQATAAITGIALILMMFLAFYAYGYAHSSLVDYSDPAVTLQNVQASPGLFTGEIVGWIAIILLDLIVTWTLYVYLRQGSQRTAMIAGISRLLYTIILSVAVVQLVKGLFMSTTATAAQAPELLSLIESFESIWSFGLIVFGVHLFAVGWAGRSIVAVPKWSIWLLLIAGVSYTFLNSLYIFLPQLDSITSTLELILMLPMTVGEIGFGIWLLIKGRKAPVHN